MKQKFILITIFILSLMLRLYQLQQLPATLNRDEAALAYNALLLKETGTDEWGRAWPLSLESFGDYKLPGYVYTLAGLFNFLPASDWVVKLPSVVAGSLLVVLAFFFAKAIRLKTPWAWLFTILVATTPVFFFYSRIAFEANLALALFVAAITLLLTKAKHRKRILFDLSAIILMLMAVFTYNTPLLLLPFILPLIIWLRGFKNWRRWLLPIAGLSLVMLMAGWQLFSLANQKSGITIFQDETTWINSVDYRLQFTGPWQKILGNRYLYFASIIGQNYLKSFSPNFLVTTQGTHPWHSLPEHGHVLAVVYYFGISGILFAGHEVLVALKNKSLTSKIKIRVSLLYLLFVSLLPAVVTVDAPHATRSLFFFFLLSIFTLYGLKSSYHLIRDHTQIKKSSLLIIFSGWLLISSFNYARDYFQNYPHQQQPLRPGFEDVVQAVEKKYPHQEVVIIDEEGYQYILLAWYLKINPTQFFTSTVKQQADKIGFKYGERVTHYHFIADVDDKNDQEQIVINWNQLENKWQVLEF